MARRKGSGSIREMGGHFYFRTQIGGKEKLVRLKAETAEGAAAEARQYVMLGEAQDAEELAVFLNRIKRNASAEQRLRLADGFAVFEKSPVRPHCGEKHLNQHRYSWRDFCAGIPAEYFDQVDAAMTERYFSEFTGGVSSFNRRVKSCRLIWRTVARKKITPFDDIRLKRERPTPKKEFDASQLAAVFDAVDQAYPLSVPHREEMRILFRILAYTGMSLKDCCMLEWQDITADAIRTRRHKTSGKVNVPLHPDLIEMLPARGEGRLLPHVADRYERNDSGVDRTVCRIIAWAMEKEHATYKAGRTVKYRLPDTANGYGAHSFRHSFVSFCANAGVPIDAVRDIVGHASSAVTRIYTHFTDQTRAAVIAALPSAKKKATVEDRSAAAEIRKILNEGKLSARERKILELLEKDRGE